MTARGLVDAWKYAARATASKVEGSTPTTSTNRCARKAYFWAGVRKPWALEIPPSACPWTCAEVVGPPPYAPAPNLAAGGCVIAR